MNTIPETMNAVVIHRRGDADVLQYENFPTPVPEANEVLIRVHAATVNHTDIFHRKGTFYIQKELPHILGMDVAGQIVAVGEGVEDWHVGDRVVATFEALGRERNGAYAEYTTIPIEHLHRIPDGMEYRAAASVGLAFVTAWLGLMVNVKMRKHEQVVIHAASSGVGTAALQIAKYKEAKIIAIAGVDKHERLRELGANIVLDRNSDDLVTLVRAVTNEQGASLVVELVGETTFQQSLEMLAYKGRIVVIGTLSGQFAAIDLMDILMKNATIYGTFDTLKEGDFDKILGMFADGTFQPVIDRVMPLSKAREAHVHIEAKQHVGKVILVPDDLF